MKQEEYRCLRVSVTDKCNLTCAYCHSKCFKNNKQLSFKEISKTVDFLSAFGILHVRLTGGEPLIRKNLARLVEMISGNGRTIAITTNGTLLKDHAKSLKSAGVERINVHLDTLDLKKYRELAGGGDVKKVLSGIETALALKIDLKINTVLLRGINDDVRPMLKLSADLEVPVRFIEMMPFCSSEFYKRHFLSAEIVVRELSLKPIYNGFGRGPAVYYKDDETKAIVGIITPVSRKFCGSCDRLRLKSDGRLKRCLANGDELDLKKIGFNKDIIQNYLLGKTFDHKNFVEGVGSSMRQIGG